MDNEGFMDDMAVYLLGFSKLTPEKGAGGLRPLVDGGLLGDLRPYLAAPPA